MDCDENGGRKIGGKIFGKVSQRLDAARRRANGQNVTIVHPKTRPFAIFVDNASASLWVPGRPHGFTVGKTPCGRYAAKNPSILEFAMADEHDGGGRKSELPGEPVIVAMGASAGGVRALQAFFGSIPAGTGAAYVVIVHLDPERRSELPSILSARTKMPVVQVHERQKIEPDHVYVIPPDRRLEMVDHEISATPFEEPHGARSPIDQFFRSVAERLGDGFAVILSGAGSDGVVGVRAVKESGGIIMVQEPSEAEYPSMPRSAIATGVVDVVMPVRELAVRLVDLIRLKRSTSIAELPKVDEELLRRVLAHLRVRTGHDFSKYKRSTVLRRIARRM